MSESWRDILGAVVAVFWLAGIVLLFWDGKVPLPHRSRE